MSFKDALDTKCNVKKLKENYSEVLAWDKKVPNTEIERFKNIIEEKYNLHFHDYWDLHRWTVDNFPSFWEEVWMYYGIVSSKPYNEVFVKSGPGFLDNKWFTGAALNYAENILRIRDDREALLCMGEEGECERVTFSEMFEEVKPYAAAFRKHGLQKGDRVACYMSNRKEALYAMLAITSIGACWGGPHAYFGPRAAANIIHNLGAKFLILVDRIQDECSGEDFNLLDNLPVISQSAPALECIIIVPTKNKTLQIDISHIPKSYLLSDFLATGLTPDGVVPDMAFEQLPFDHPVFISFSSGTTGLPKGIMHSTGCLLGTMADFGLHCNIKRGDTVYSYYAMGWSVWNYMATTLSLGVRLFLHNGNPFSKSGGKTTWDLMSEHQVTFVLLVPSTVDRMEKMNILPKHGTKFENLECLMLGGSTVKVQNYKYLKSFIKEDVFIGNMYGSTENFGPVSGCDFNSPCYAREVQVPALGRDVHVFDKDGRSVIGEKGELVVTKPCPNFLIGLWKDANNELTNRTYFSKYPGVFQQNDEGFVNPRTKGLVILGRSDDTLMQNGDRIGPADIYFAIHGMEEIDDYICVGQNRQNGDSRAVLFIKLKEGHTFTPEFREKVVRRIEAELWEECVPEVILQVKGIPYNTNNKRVESLIRKIIANNEIPVEVNIKNPECLTDYCNIPEIINYNNI